MSARSVTTEDALRAFKRFIDDPTEPPERLGERLRADELELAADVETAIDLMDGAERARRLGSEGPITLAAIRANPAAFPLERLLGLAASRDFCGVLGRMLRAGGAELLCGGPALGTPVRVRFRLPPEAAQPRLDARRVASR